MIWSFFLSGPCTHLPLSVSTPYIVRVLLLRLSPLKAIPFLKMLYMRFCNGGNDKFPGRPEHCAKFHPEHNFSAHSLHTRSRIHCGAFQGSNLHISECSCLHIHRSLPPAGYFRRP